MKKRLTVASLLPALLILLSGLFFASCGTGKDTSASAEQDFKAAYEKYRMSDDRMEKAALMDKFAANHPDSETAGRAIEMVVYNRYMINEDYQGALVYLDKKIGEISDPAVLKSVKLLKLEALAELKEESALTILAEDLLNSADGLASGERLQVLGAATRSGAWYLADKVSGMLLDDLKDSDDPYSKSAVLMQKGWILHNLGQNEEALKFFEEADFIGPKNFAGYSEYPAMELEYQWATALLAAGRAKDALDKFEIRALFVKEENSDLQNSYQGLLKQAYLEAGKNEASFPAYKAERKAELSRQVPEFSAPDSNGKTLSFSEIRGEKATLLVFWFPT